MVSGSLVGRERELAVLSDMVGERGLRLVTITGPGGVGKTRVAYAVADAVAQDPSWRVLRIDLEPLADAALVADAIAVAVDAPNRSRGGSALRAAVDALGEERALLVLDNFEHLVPAAGDVAALIESCPGVTALVTSRQVLGVTAEHMFPLAPLALPEPDDADPARVARSAAVELFVARARARDPQFELTPEVTGAVAEICRRLDGLPLAIELAAARMAVLPPAAMIARWDAAVGLDAPGPSDLPARQQTLRRAFDWSYELLGEAERALLRRLAAFPGGFDIAAVEAACAGDGDVLPALDVEPIETLAGFVDRSLVTRDPGGSSIEPRYSQLRTVRSYLREQLGDRGEAAAADLLMAAACEASARRAGQFLAAGRSREELDRLERELNNMRAALSVLVAAAPDRAVGLAVDLTGLWETRHVTEGREWVRRALDAGGERPRAGPARERAVDRGAARPLPGRLRRRAAAGGGQPGGGTRRGRPADAGAGAVRRGAVDRRPTRRSATSATASSSRCASAWATMPASRWRATTSARSRGPPASWRTRSRSTSGRSRGGAPGRTPAAWRARRTTSRRRCCSSASSTAPRRCWSRRWRRRGASATATRRPAPWLAWRRRPPRGSRAPPPRRCTERRRRSSRRSTSRSTRSTRGRFEPRRRRLRAALGDARFAEASARGRGLSADERRRLAERLAAGAPAPASDVLTRRELEVVRLVAAGLTNAEIAQRLVVSDHTVHRHVSNILGKLGVPSRAAAASLAAQRGLL